MPRPDRRSSTHVIHRATALLIAAVAVLAADRSIGQAPMPTDVPVAVPAWRHAATVGVIEIHGEIDAITKTTL